MLTIDFLSFLPYSLLTLAIIAVWVPRNTAKPSSVPLWCLLFGLSLLSGFVSEALNIYGVIYLIALWATARFTVNPSLNIAFRLAAGITTILLTVALFVHAIPFYNNLLVFNSYSFGHQSSEYTKYLNFDKGAAGLILLAYFGEISKSGLSWLRCLKHSTPYTLATLMVSFTLALMLGFVQIDIKWTPLFWIWAWMNLFFTCVAEEMLFRGVIQQNLLKLSTLRYTQYAIVVIVGILFGLAHIGGGALYAVLSAISGIGYGFAYFSSKKIEAAILSHFLLNAIHFIFFSYPYFVY